MKREALDCTH